MVASGGLVWVEVVGELFCWCLVASLLASVRSRLLLGFLWPLWPRLRVSSLHCASFRFSLVCPPGRGSWFWLGCWVSGYLSSSRFWMRGLCCPSRRTTCSWGCRKCSSGCAWQGCCARWHRLSGGRCPLWRCYFCSGRIGLCSPPISIGPCGP